MAGFANNPVKRTRWGAKPSQVVGDGCDLEFTTDLVGVRSDISAALEPGDRLIVAIHQRDQVRSAVCQTHKGDVVGTLAAFVGLARLLACMYDGVTYLAFVQTASATRCSVRVLRQ